MQFAKDIKEYVFRRIKKQILLKLAMCLIQDLAANGPDRGGLIQLQLERRQPVGKKSSSLKRKTSFPSIKRRRVRDTSLERREDALDIALMHNAANLFT